MYIQRTVKLRPKILSLCFVLLVEALTTSIAVAEFDKEHLEALSRLATEFKAADVRLNTVYKELQLRLFDRGKIRLQEAQRAWIPYRDKVCKFVEDLELYSGKAGELAEKRCLLELTIARVAELENAERLVNPDPVIVPGEGKSLSWPNHLGRSEERGVACISGAAGFERQIEERLGSTHVYTTACQIADSIVMLLDEYGGNSDPIGVLDLTKRGGPIELGRGLPWLEKVIKDKSGALHIVVGNTVLRLGFLGSQLTLYSIKTWDGLAIANSSGVDDQSGSLQCPEKGGYGYETTREVLKETHKYEDRNGDGFEDIVVETVITSCASGKTKTITKTFLATESGFKEAPTNQASNKVRSRRP
jgi:uncharacterized protein YecT (DUF1311 family)